MRLGAPVFGFENAAEWAAAHVRKGYGAAYWPLAPDAPDAEARAYVEAAKAHGLVIAEVGIWNNLLDRDAAAREANIRASIAKLRLADAVGARCCVNISGSLSATWDGPHRDNLTEQTFARIVETTRRIIDEAAPTRTCYTLEPMPWMYPCDAESALRLVEAVARPAFAVHVDMCNLMNSPEKVFQNARETRRFFDLLGPRIRSIHAKDVVIGPGLTVHIDEALPGEGMFDFDELLRQAHGLGDVPVMCEHLPTEAAYDKAAGFLKSRAAALGLSFTAAR